MKLLLAAACLCCAGCAYTVVKDGHGNTRFRTLGNIKQLSYQDENTRLEIVGLNHSLPSAATGKAISGVANSVGTAISGAAAGAILVP